MRTPLRAALVSPETTETGVEMTKAQGQAITSSVSPRTNHSVNGPPTISGGTVIVSNAAATTIGV